MHHSTCGSGRADGHHQGSPHREMGRAAKAWWHFGVLSGFGRVLAVGSLAVEPLFLRHSMSMTMPTSRDCSEAREACGLRLAQPGCSVRSTQHVVRRFFARAVLVEAPFIWFATAGHERFTAIIR